MVWRYFWYSSVIRQKSESQNGDSKKIKHVKFSEKTDISYPLIRTHMFFFFCHLRFEIRTIALLPTTYLLKIFHLLFCFYQLMLPNPDYWICIYILLWNGDHFSCNQTAQCHLYNSRSSYSHPTVINNNDKTINSARKKTVFDQYFGKFFYLCAGNLS